MPLYLELYASHGEAHHRFLARWEQLIVASQSLLHHVYVRLQLGLCRLFGNERGVACLKGPRNRAGALPI